MKEINLIIFLGGCNLRSHIISLLVTFSIVLIVAGCLQQSEKIDLFLRGDEATGIIVKKLSEQSILLGSKYYVYVDVKDSNGSFYKINHPTRVTKKQFFKLKETNTLNGYLVNDVYFYTTYGQWLDRLKILWVFITVSIILFFIIFSIFINFEEQEKQKYKKTKKRKQLRDSKNKIDFNYSLMIFFSFCMFLLFLYLTIFYAMNGYYKYITNDKETVIASITNHHRHCLIRHALYEKEPLWQRYTCNNQVDLLFYDKEGREIVVNKRVLTGTYDILRHKQFVEISYIKENPYKVYFPNRSFYEGFSIYGTGDVAFIIFIYPISMGFSFFLFNLIYKNIKHMRRKSN